MQRMAPTGQSLVTSGQRAAAGTQRRRGHVCLSFLRGYRIRIARSYSGSILDCRVSTARVVGGRTHTALVGDRRFGVFIPLFWGRWWTAMPLQTPIHTVIGRPIKLPAVPAAGAGARASDEEVDKWHAVRRLLAPHHVL